jgi:small subunit ribosomal protein S2
VFILDTKKEHIGVTEANKLGIPIIAVVDTNCDPDIIQYVIPGNDDAIRSGSLMCRVIADAVEEGRFIASRRGTGTAPAAERTEDDEARVAAEQAEARRQALLAQQERDARLSSGGAPIPPPPAIAEAPVTDAAPEPAPAAEPGAAPEPEAPAAAEAPTADGGSPYRTHPGAHPACRSLPRTSRTSARPLAPG